jgi:hypothetical protein
MKIRGFLHAHKFHMICHILITFWLRTSRYVWNVYTAQRQSNMSVLFALRKDWIWTNKLKNCNSHTFTISSNVRSLLSDPITPFLSIANWRSSGDVTKWPYTAKSTTFSRRVISEPTDFSNTWKKLQNGCLVNSVRKVVHNETSSTQK